MIRYFPPPCSALLSYGRCGSGCSRSLALALPVPPEKWNATTCCRFPSFLLRFPCVFPLERRRKSSLSFRNRLRNAGLKSRSSRSFWRVCLPAISTAQKSRVTARKVGKAQFFSSHYYRLRGKATTATTASASTRRAKNEHHKPEFRGELVCARPPSVPLHLLSVCEDQ